MQSAETVLNVLRERGRRGLPCNELYRQMSNPSLYLLAYGRLYSNQGAMTPGVNGETADGMSEAKIGRIIDALRHERYRFQPVRRIHIPKKDGKTRPLGLPSWSDKLVGEVVRLLLEAYYEPTFSDRSHGFRPGRGCHTALREVADTWAGTTWFVEGDIADCFGSLDHSTLLGTLGERIHDNRFLRLLRNMLEAGYVEDWEWNATLSGAPQGGVVSPVLSNIYLDRLDKFVERVLIPQYTRGDRKAVNPAYGQVRTAMRRARRHGDQAAERELRKRLHRLPSRDPQDPGYRRLKYTRYADDHLLGFIGPKAEEGRRLVRLPCRVVGPGAFVFRRFPGRLSHPSARHLVATFPAPAASIRACGSPAHGSPTPFTAGIRLPPPGPVRPGGDNDPNKAGQTQPGGCANAHQPSAEPAPPAVALAEEQSQPHLRVPVQLREAAGRIAVLEIRGPAVEEPVDLLHHHLHGHPQPRPVGQLPQPLPSVLHSLVRGPAGQEGDRPFPVTGRRSHQV